MRVCVVVFFVFILIKTIRLTWEYHLNSIITITSPVLASGRDNTDAEIGLYVTLDPARIYQGKKDST